MNKRKTLALVFVVFCSLFFGGKGANAAVSSTAMADKAIYAGVAKCFETQFASGGMIESIVVEDFEGIDSLANGNKFIPLIGKVSDNISCNELLTTKTAKKIEKNVTNKTVNERGKILSDSGYSTKKSGSNDADYCYSYRIIAASKDFSSEEITYTPQLCVKKSESGYTFSFNNASNSKAVYFTKNSNNTITINYPGIPNKNSLNCNNGSIDSDVVYDINEYGSNCTATFKINGAGNSEWDILAKLGNEIASRIGSGRQTNIISNMATKSNKLYYAACSSYTSTSDGLTCNGTEYGGGKNAGQFSYKYSAADLIGTEVYERGSRDTAIEKLSGRKYQRISSLKFNDNEKYSLYYYYLKDVYGISDMSCNDTAGGEWDGGGRTYKAKLWWAEGKKYTTCAFNVSQANAKVNGVGSDGIFGVPMSLQDMISALDGLNPTGEPTEYVVPTSMNNTGSEDTEATCLNTAGANGLGWILCPILDLLNGATDSVYSSVVEPNLQVEPALFQGTDEDNSVRNAWNSFRDIANIFFIIMLLIVIFSQLTGIGIDNYGIKKILPKMLVAAVLINLSYLVCLLLVDVSNIAGNGFRALFDVLGTNLGTSVNFASEGGSAVDVLTGSLTSIGILGAAAGAIPMLANPAILLSLFVSALGVFVGVFFLFILLSARKAIIIVLTVISPLAVVAYMLPNTKKMFDKWWSAFTGLLLVYPIAGLLVGAGDYISKLLLTVSNNYFGALTAMIAGIAPIFFIPMLLKGSFSALGKVGGAIAGFGAGARQGFGKFARGTNAYKNLQERGMATNARWRAGVDSNGKQRDLNAFGRFIRGGNRGIAGARSQYLADVDKRNKENSLMGDGFAAAVTAMGAKARDDMVSQRLSLMQSNGIGNGKAFTLDNAFARMQSLELNSRNGALSDDEQLEMAALARGMSGMKGGASKLAGVIRGANNGSGGANNSFMSAMGKIYSDDSLVQKKLNEKDAGASAYTEGFMPGATPGEKDFAGFKDEMQRTRENGIDKYTQTIKGRMQTYEAGLNQSAAARDEYLKTLTKDDCDRISRDDKLMNSLAADDRKAFLDYASSINGGLIL